MKRLLIILLSAFSLAVSAEKMKIALLEPRVGEGSTSVSGMEKAMVRGELRKAIVNFTDYEAITRADIDQLMKEQNFQRTGMVSDSQIKKMGELSGADYICVSTLTKSNSEFYLEAYLIHLESGTIYNPASQYGELTDGKLANMLPVCQAMAEELLNNKVATSRTTSNTIARSSSNNTKKPAKDSKSITIEWHIGTKPKGAEIQWRVVSGTPEVEDTDWQFLGMSPVTGKMNHIIPGITDNNAKYVFIEIRAMKSGKYSVPQKVCVADCSTGNTSRAFYFTF